MYLSQNFDNASKFNKTKIVATIGPATSSVEMLEKIIVASTGAGYLVVGISQLFKGSIPNAMIWVGYAFAQVGLWMALK